MHKLPDTGLLRLSDVIGEGAITKEQAEENRAYNERAAADALKNGRVDKQGRPIYARRPTRPRPATPAIIPVKKSCWWDGVKTGRFPKPVKLGRCTMWRVEDIRSLIASA
jgi:prophage regulatory protein